MSLSGRLADYLAVSQALTGNERKGIARMRELARDEPRFVEVLNALTLGALDGLPTAADVVASEKAMGAIAANATAAKVAFFREDTASAAVSNTAALDALLASESHFKAVLSDAKLSKILLASDYVINDLLRNDGMFDYVVGNVSPLLGFVANANAMSMIAANGELSERLALGVNTSSQTKRVLLKSASGFTQVGRRGSLSSGSSFSQANEGIIVALLETTSTSYKVQKIQIARDSKFSDVAFASDGGAESANGMGYVQSCKPFDEADITDAQLFNVVFFTKSVPYVKPTLSYADGSYYAYVSTLTF